MTEVLRRYTDVLSLLDILRHNRLTLLSPSRWYDQNDALGLKLYCDTLGEGRVYALCLAEGVEQAHHWQIFAGHVHGLCIQFDKIALIEHLSNLKKKNNIIYNILFGPMKYYNLKQISDMNSIDTDIILFLKRDTFKAESEYRIIAWEDELFASDNYEIPMPAGLIKQVTVGPNMPKSLAKTLKETAQSMPGCSEITFRISSLVNNASWEKAILEGVKVKR